MAAVLTQMGWDGCADWDQNTPKCDNDGVVGGVLKWFFIQRWAGKDQVLFFKLITLVLIYQPYLGIGADLSVEISLRQCSRVNYETPNKVLINLMTVNNHILKTPPLKVHRAQPTGFLTCRDALWGKGRFVFWTSVCLSENHCNHMIQLFPSTDWFSSRLTWNLHTRWDLSVTLCPRFKLINTNLFMNISLHQFFGCTHV